MEHGLSTSDPDEAATKSAMIAAARRVVVLADSRKISAESTNSFARLSDIDVLITGHGIPQRQLEGLRKAGVEVMRV